MAGLSTNAPGLWGGFAGLLYGSTSLSTPPGFLADATPAWVLPGAALDLDFADSLGYNSRNLATTTPDSILTYTSPSPKLVYGSDGVLRYAPHNLFLNSGAPATQNVTLITGFSYTVTVTGSGSLAGSSGASGTASAGNPATFVATGTTGTFTLTGSLTTIQLNRAPAHSRYIPTTSAAVYSLPIDHNPITFDPLGVLIEEQRTNLRTYSEQFDSGVWTNSASAVTANTSTSPDGGVNADKLSEDTTSNIHRLANFASYTSGTVYTWSVYAKQSGRFLYINAAAIAARAVFHLSNGTTSAAVGTSTITDVGGGWYRCSVTGTAPATTSTSMFMQINNSYAASDLTYLGDGTSGIYLWGAQLEAGSFPTSYIPTVASQVTRAADQVSILTSAFGYNAAESTLVVEALIPNINGVPSNLLSTTANILYTYRLNSTTMYLYGLTGGAFMVGIAAGGAPSASFNKFAWAAKQDDFAISANGGAVSPDTLGNMPASATTLQIGGYDNGSTKKADGHIKRITYFPTRKSNADLQVLTRGDDLVWGIGDYLVWGSGNNLTW